MGEVMADTGNQAGEAHRYLLARSSLGDYLDFVESYSMNTEDANRKIHSTAWKAADLHMRKLREVEHDRADVELRSDLPPNLLPLVGRVEADTHFRRAFEETTWEIAMVDLDGVIASQKLVSAEHVARLQKKLSPMLGDEDLFRFCLPFDRQPPDFRASRIDSDEFAFVSQSNDLRFQEAVLLRPDQIVGFETVGPIAGVLALVVGFGSNYLNVIRANGRFVLNNGNHRACALYQSGYRRVPCVIQTITHPAEFEMHMPKVIQRNGDFYLSDPRPPVIADYFDQQLSREMMLGMTAKEIRLNYQVDEKDVP
jgi:hypothetical protein